MKLDIRTKTANKKLDIVIQGKHIEIIEIENNIINFKCDNKTVLMLAKENIIKINNFKI